MPAVMALFQSPDHAERAVAELSLNGFTEKDVSMVIFSATRRSPTGGKGFLSWLGRGGLLGDSIDRSDGVSVMDGACVGAVFGGLLGLVYGVLWVYGPIALGTLGLLAGGIVGIVVDRLIPEKRRDQLETSLIPGLIMIQVEHVLAERAEAAKRVLQANQAKQMADLPASQSARST